jgi:protein SDA1
MASPGTATDSGVVSFRELVDFVAHVAECYPDLTKTFPDDLMQLLRTHNADLGHELREKLVGSLVLLRKKDVIDSSTLLSTLFPILTSTPSKGFRALLFQKILSDLRSSNSKTTNHRLNRTIQTVLFNLLTSDRTSSKGIWAVKLTHELWKRQIWSDSKAVEIMKEAALADNEKVIVGGVRFFLGGDKEREELEDESSDEEAIDIKRLKHQGGINKKKGSTARRLEKAVVQVKKKEKKKKAPHALNFSALHLLHDPQGFAETLFTKHLQRTHSPLNLEQKLLVLQLVSRLVGLHKLTVISLYSYFLKYLNPRQPSVTSFLASLAQSTHNLVPPDVLEPLVQKIANEFVSEASASAVCCVGLNAIREICVRQPLAMNDTLLQDLVMYRKSKDKGVMMAAKGLLSLFREVGADMLKKRDRGKVATMSISSGDRKERRFGEEEGGEIEGIELLEAWKEEQRLKKREELGLASDEEDPDEDEEDDDEAWEIASNDSDDSGGWIAVESDEEIDISDSDDDKPPAKKMKIVKKLGKFVEEVDEEAEAEAKAQAEAEGDDDEDDQDDDNEDEEEVNEADSDEEKENTPVIAARKASNYATTRILTPADLIKLQELRLAAAVDKSLPKSKRQRKSLDANDKNHEDGVEVDDLTGLAALYAGKDKQRRLEMMMAGREGRDKFSSKKAKKQEEKKSSTTNKEKARKKNFLMTRPRAKGKQKRSLVETRRTLKAHVDRQKRGGKRGNNS